MRVCVCNCVYVNWGCVCLGFGGREKKTVGSDKGITGCIHMHIYTWDHDLDIYVCIERKINTKNPQDEGEG